MLRKTTIGSPKNLKWSDAVGIVKECVSSMYPGFISSIGVRTAAGIQKYREGAKSQSTGRELLLQHPYLMGGAGKGNRCEAPAPPQIISHHPPPWGASLLSWILFLACCL